jgi:hypothetical protein
VAKIVGAIVEAILNFLWGKRDQDNEVVEIDSGGKSLDDCERL